MTREDAKEFLIDISYKLGNMAIEYLTEKDGEKMREAIKALEQEPTTKKDCNTCTHSDEIDGYNCYECIKGMRNNYEPTTKNDLGVDCNNCKNNLRRDDGTSYCDNSDKMCHYECAENTKSDLGVDLISRADVLKLMQDNWHTHNGDWAMQESMDDIRALPSVTPQEPFINKPCVSSGVCEHDKQKVLDKIRAEIEIWHKEGKNWSDIRLMNIEDILDKYKVDTGK